MKEHTTFFSDGTGQAYEAEIEKTNNNEIPPLNNKSTRSTVVENPFEGLPTARDAKTIPKSLSSAFTKILQAEFDGIIYTYREMSFLEQLSLGTNPYLDHALTIYNAEDDKLDEEEFVKNLICLLYTSPSPRD